ncbi:lysylphosphatidylglycerol synthase domain-containing protein [Rhizobium sp. 3T7]|uniref:lysylphosphatidylglycerol synthase domain-containing protein n=1 Tax=Rhizobium sp. 3T7 TaxID=2874922 RepID=UPI001CC91AD0|nr:lysylphosphatidylglycerol synthase domain-containing protein [Rhizobium sp. 3T7]MBZ9792577.1 lysylphosphatidylglycerol synthase domain-containing protein [Rhizobium sp. 3T7]
MSARRVIFNFLLVFGLLLAAYLLYRVFSRYTFDEVLQSVRQISSWRLVSGVAFCALSYLCLTGFDWMALQYVGRPLTYPKAAVASFTALAIGHNLGVAALSSGAVRYRYYTRWGLNAEEVAKVVLFCGVTVMLGLSALGSIVCLINPTDVSKLLGVNAGDPLWIGLGVLSLPVTYVVLSATVRSPLQLWKWRFAMPNTSLAIGQIVIGTLNFSFVAACLHQVLASEAPVSFVQSATAFVLANVAILVAHVPGGLGVLEATVTTVLPGAASIGGLVAFRVIYFLLPLLLGLPVFAISELIIGSGKKTHLDKGSKKPPQPQAQLL